VPAFHVLRPNIICPSRLPGRRLVCRDAFALPLRCTLFTYVVSHTHTRIVAQKSRGKNRPAGQFALQLRGSVCVCTYVCSRSRSGRCRPTVTRLCTRVCVCIYIYTYTRSRSRTLPSNRRLSFPLPAEQLFRRAARDGGWGGDARTIFGVRVVSGRVQRQFGRVLPDPFYRLIRLNVRTAACPYSRVGPAPVSVWTVSRKIRHSRLQQLPPPPPPAPRAIISRTRVYRS